MSAKQPTVEEFLTNLDHPRVDDIRRVRAGLLADDAELGERIKWNAPSFGHDGDDRVTFRLQPETDSNSSFIAASKNGTTRSASTTPINSSPGPPATEAPPSSLTH